MYTLYQPISGYPRVLVKISAAVPFEEGPLQFRESESEGHINRVLSVLHREWKVWLASHKALRQAGHKSCNKLRSPFSRDCQATLAFDTKPC